MTQTTNYVPMLTDYANACNTMVKAFCERHDFTYEKDCWVGGEAGGFAAIGDFFFDMQTICYDLNNTPDKDELLKWQDYCSRVFALGIKSPVNYKSWCNGAPRISEEELTRLEELKRELTLSIDGYNNNSNGY